MTSDEAQPRQVDDVQDLFRALEEVRTQVLWKTSGRQEAISGMEEHHLEKIPSEGISIGLAVARSGTRLSVRISILVSADGVYVRADTSTTYHWSEELDVTDDCARQLLRQDGVQRALATSSAHLVDAATAIGAEVENPALQFQNQVLEMVESDAVFD